MLHRALLFAFVPLCVKSVQLRLAPIPPHSVVSVESLYGADGLYHDPDAIFEEFGTQHLLDATPSFCVFSRIIVQELPYIRSFLEHYVHLGVGTFYFVNNMYQQHDRIADVLQTQAIDLSTRVVLHSVHVTDADAALNDMALLGRVDEDFVIGVDVDEYWVLPDGIPSFESLVRSHPASDYRAQWVMVPNDEIDGSASRPYRGFRGANGKWMANVSTLQQIAVTPHKPMFADAFVERETMTQAGELIHFWGRSFLDQLTKGLGQELHNRAGEDLEEVRKMTNEGKVPERLQMLAFLMNLDRDITVDVSADLVTIDRDLEKSIASEIFQSNITSAEEEVEKIHAVYTKFKAHVAEVMRTQDYPAYPDHGLEKIAPWLAKIGQSMPH